MIGNLLISAGRVAIDTLRDQKMINDIERELNGQFTGRRWEFANYRNEEVTISIESIAVRPKYFPKKTGTGVAEIEADNFFTNLGNERSSPTFTEKAYAVFKDRWITILRLEIENGGADLVRPPGLNLDYVTTTTAMRKGGSALEESQPIDPIPQMRIAETHDLQSDKLEMKVRYDGSVGEYNKRLSDAVDLIKHLQQDMDTYVIRYLLELYHSVHGGGNSGFEGESEERAKQLGEYFVGHPIEIDSLENKLEKITEELEADWEED